MHLEKFRDLFNPLPGNHYLQVTTEIDATTELMSELTKSVDGEFSLVVYNEKKDLQEIEGAKLQHYKTLDKPFRALPRDHDIVVFKGIFHLHKYPKVILKTAYATLANAANIVIMQKKGTMNIQETIDTLDAFEFRSANYIDLMPEFDIVVAKKMHMWGNGL